MQAFATFALIMFASLAIATELTDRTVLTVENPKKGDTYTFKCPTGEHHVLVFTVSKEVAQFTVTSVPTQESLPATLTGDPSKADNVIAGVLCRNDTVFTVTLNSDGVTKAGILVATSTGSKLFPGEDKQLKGKQGKLTGTLFNIDLDSGRLFAAVTLIATQNPLFIAFAQDEQGKWQNIGTGAGKLTTCPNVHANKRFVYLVNLDSDNEYDWTVRYDKINAATQITPGATIPLDAGSVYDVATTVKALIGTNRVFVYATCADFLASKPVVRQPANLWAPKFGISIDAVTLPSFFAVSGTGSLTGLAEDKTPANCASPNQIKLPDNTCPCPGIYKAPACTVVNTDIITVVPQTQKNAPQAKHFEYKAADITANNFLGWNIVLPAETHLQIQVTLDDVKDSSITVGVDSAAWPSWTSGNAVGEYYDSLTLVPKQSVTVAYCKDVISTFYIGIFANAATTGTITFTYIDAPYNKVSDAPVTIELSGDVDMQYLCLSTPVLAGTQITVQTCSLPNNNEYTADSAKVTVGGFASSVLEQHGVYVYESTKHTDFNNVMKQGYLVPTQIKGTKNAKVLYYTTVATATSFPFQIGRTDGNDLAYGELVFGEPTKDVANYTVSVKDGRDVKDVTSTVYLIEKPDFDINLAASPCFVTGLKDQKVVKIGDKLETIYQSEDEERSFYLVGFAQPAATNAVNTAAYKPANLKLDKKEKKKNGSNKGLIIGLAVGGSLLLVVALVGGYFLWQRRRVGYSGLS